jgi:ketosteroid isomerase-like protein
MNTDEMHRLARAADCQEIRDCLMRYCRGIDRGDGDILRSAYHDDATEHHGPFEGLVADFVPFVLEVLANVEVCLHMVTNIHIEVNGDKALSEAYFVAIQRESGEAVEDYIAGRYLDQFERRQGEWRIAHRQVMLDWSRREPFHGPSPYGPLASFPLSRRDSGDALYTTQRQLRTPGHCCEVMTYE